MLIKHNYSIMLLVIFFSLTVSAQNKYAKLDKIARTKIPIEHNSTPGKIASYLISFAKNDEEKARILFVYSTHVLRYDIRRSGKNASASWSIKNGVGVCWNYANLYSDLCRAAGLKCIVVTGYSRGYSRFIPFRKARKKKGLHAWNAVRIDKKWYLVDPTWADGGSKLNRDVNGKKILKSNFNEKWWLPSPEIMILDHYPWYPKWQLVNSVVTIGQYRIGRRAIQNMDKRTPNYNFNDTIQKYFWLPAEDKELEKAKDFYRNDRGSKNSVQSIVNAYGKKMEKAKDYDQAIEYLKACRPYTHGSPIKVFRHAKIRRKLAQYKWNYRIGKLLS